MHTFTAKTVEPGVAPATTLTLPLERRIKSRQRAILDNGEEAGIFLARGKTLHDGDLLVSTGGMVIKILAAEEQLSLVVCGNTLLLARACYHLGNRHVPVQIAEHSLTYQSDHVIDDMIRSMGLEVKRITAPFEPESGVSVGSGAHSHGI